jgi:tRNA pseudouridine55 synthase
MNPSAVLESGDGFVFLIDKPSTWTSFDVVNKIRRTMREKKVGHAGTLDPLATGLVIVCTCKNTKKIEDFMGLEKGYEGTFFLGATTPSYDAETEIDARFPTEHITEKMILKMAESFIGEQWQTPPLFSAIKVEGRKLYELARKGKNPARLSPRQVEIKQFKIKAIRENEVDFYCLVSKGTYIRSLAFDFGKALGSGAYLSSLRRTSIGNYTIENAKSIPDWLAWWKERGVKLNEENPNSEASNSEKSNSSDSFPAQNFKIK